MEVSEQLFKHPFSCVVAGPSKSGKTVFVNKFVKFVDQLCDISPVVILWCYTEWQPAYNEIAQQPRVRFYEGIPDLTRLKTDVSRPKLIVFDDMMSDFKKDDTLTQLFTKGVHHWNVSAIHIVQNLFFAGSRSARVNAHYVVLLKNPSDKLQVSTLGRQLYPRKSTFFAEAYQDATSRPHSYLLLDLTQDCPEELRLRTDIFPDELQIIYSP